MIERLAPLPDANFMVGRLGNPVTFIVDHWMAGPFAASEARFRNPSEQVSAHYGVLQDGRIVQFVDEADTAFHAGRFEDNLLSIGIEHEASPTMPPSEALYRATAWLHRDIAARHGIRLEAGVTVKRHQQIVPTQCPGTLHIERILEDDMAFKDDPDAQAYVADVRNTFEAIKTVLSQLADGERADAAALARIAQAAKP